MKLKVHLIQECILSMAKYSTLEEKQLLQNLMNLLLFFAWSEMLWEHTVVANW